MSTFKIGDDVTVREYYGRGAAVYRDVVVFVGKRHIRLSYRRKDNWNLDGSRSSYPRERQFALSTDEDKATVRSIAKDDAKAREGGR